MAGPQCYSHPPALNPSAGAGHVEQLGGLSTYVNGSPGSNKAILLISNVFGYEAPNLRKIADKVAATGFYVVVPDFFFGDPYVPSDTNRPLPVWLKDHGADKGFEDAKPVIEALKSKGVSAIGAAGFCWGAKVVVELAKSEFIQAAVQLHPSFVTLDDIKGVKIPIAVLGAEIDEFSPQELLKQFEEVLAAKSECLENPPTLSSTSGAGTVQEFGGLQTYVSGSPDSKLAILLLSDVFGYEAPNLRKLADKFAAAGFFVVVPDFFYGDPVINIDDPQFDLASWLKAHPKDKGCEDAKLVISTLKSKGFSAIGAAGFCWGGMAVVKLASSTDIQAAIALHPGPITEDEVNNVKINFAILGAEIDQYSPPAQLKQFGEILSVKSEFDSFVKIFPGVAHGWTVRYSIEDEAAVKSAEEAHLDMLNWFTKHVK